MIPELIEAQEAELKTEELLDISGLGKRRLSRFDSSLPMQSQSRERSRRLWTVADSVCVIGAAELVERGLDEAAAIRVVAYLAPEFVSIVAEQRQVFALAIRDENAANGFRVVAGSDKGQLLDQLLDHPGATIVDVTALVRNALGRLLTAKRSERAA